MVYHVSIRKCKDLPRRAAGKQNDRHRELLTQVGRLRLGKRIFFHNGTSEIKAINLKGKFNPNGRALKLINSTKLDPILQGQKTNF